jgi:internalin A
LTKLADLELGWNKISDLSPLAGLVNLREIDLENCPVTDFSPLGHLPKLERVNGKKYRRPA